MKNSICEDVSTQLVGYVDGELAPEEAKRIENHLATCADCTTAAVTTISSIDSAASVRVKSNVSPRATMTSVIDWLA